MTDWGFTLNNVTASWSEDGQHNILEPINYQFQVRDANTAALPLMGPSGEGKSTLLYLLAALKLPTTGTVTWQFPTNDPKTYHLNQLAQSSHKDIVELRRDHFGFAFQDSTLSLYLTVRENIAYPLLLQGQKWNDALKTAESRFDQVLVDEDDQKKKRLLDSFPSQLSGGERQRAALAQAMIHNPYVIFADEPTGQLDVKTRLQVMRVLKRWVEDGQGKRCLIWVTHHHVGDLTWMDVDKLLFIENKKCTPRDRTWLENWIKLD